MDSVSVDIKKEVAQWMRRLYKKGLTTSLGGNISKRIDASRIAITASETDKGKIKAAQIAIVDMDGTCLDMDVKISMETEMHLSIYRSRVDVNAIVHAHPVMSSVFTVINGEINTRLLAEAYTIIGDPVKATYQLPGSVELAKVVAEAAAKSNVVLMANHGVLAVGDTLLKAFDRVEVLENAARMTIMTTLLNDTNELTSQQLQLLNLSFK